jgi:chloramphenicol-sensitive protein RarD
VLWGLSPLLYQAIGRAGPDAWEITGHRAIWSVFLAGALVLLARQGPDVLRAVRRPRTLALLATSTALLAVNWTLFVWAVNNGRTLETSLGYYLNPLLNMALGAMLFRERVDRFGQVAIAAAAVGVLLQGLALGALPVISLVLAFSFAAYGAIRKQINVEAQAGLFVECLLLAPFGLAYVLWLGPAAGHFLDAPAPALLLISGAAMTVGPLVLFSWAARRLPYATMGFVQFLAPTLSFSIGVSQGEPLNALRLLSFAFIWAGAAVYAYGAWLRARRLRALQLAPL